MAQRKPFDPSRLRPPASEAPPGDARAPLSVRQVNELVGAAIARGVPTTLHVVGEIGDFAQAASGHLYFTLKDQDSELRCVMWRSSAAKLKFAPEGGMEVIASGAIEVYAPRGSYQLIVRKLEPRGVGALEAAFRQLREKLAAEGLLDAERKRPLPAFPQRIAVVTSTTGAAIRDILHTLRRRFCGLDVYVFPTRVQGEGAAQEIAAAIRLMNRVAAQLGGLDAAIVGRGGGSLEDLWAFNEEVVARAIAASDVPIVSAVGHEVDVSISDLVADVRAATPTAAAEIITPTREELSEQLDGSVARLRRGVRHRLELSRAELRVLLASEALARPLRRTNEVRQRFDEALTDVEHAAHERVRRLRRGVDLAEMRVLRRVSGVEYARRSGDLQRRVERLERVLAARMHRAGRAFETHHARLRLADLARETSRRAAELDTLQRRANAGVSRMAGHMRRLLNSRVDAIRACDPKSVLRRGYSITRDAKTRRVVRSVKDVRDKMRIITEVADGEFRATAADPRQPGLFAES